MFFMHLKIGSRLALCFATLVGLLLLLATLAYVRIETISHTIEQQNHIRTNMLGPLYVAREALGQTGIAARNAYVYADDQAADRELAIVDAQKRLYLEALSKAEPYLATTPGFDKVRTGLLTMADELARPAQFRHARQMEAFGKFLEQECSPLRRRIVADMEVVLRAIEQQSHGATMRSEAVVQDSVAILGGISVIALMVSVVLAVQVTRSIVRPLQQAVDFARAAADGDLTKDIAVAARDETGNLMAALKHMQDNLSGIVVRVRNGAQAIATASAEVSAGNDDLSNRTEQTASSLQETAASVEQLTATVRQSADNARAAKSLAQTAADIASHGGGLVDEVVGTMGEIDAASEQIGDIIGVIDGIAFQTNILALNAAVEAARAGEQGRGFAVVASEVRALAQRSATAAREIRELITTSSGKVGHGSALVQRAGTTMQDLVQSVRQVARIVTEMSTASGEQATGIELINKAVNEVDQVTQQNAALVEQAAAAAQSMQQEAARLAAEVGVFRVAGAAPGIAGAMPTLARDSVAKRLQPGG